MRNIALKGYVIMDALWVALTVYPDSALTVGITDIVCDKNVVARAGTELV